MLVLDQLRKNDSPLRLLALGVSLGLAVLLCGLAYVQVVSAKRYKESEMDQSFRTVRIPAVRGRILDSRGLVLAENRANYHIGLYVDELSKPFQEHFQNQLLLLRYPDGNRKSTPRKVAKDQRQLLELQTRYQVASNVVQQLEQIMRQDLPPLDEAAFHRHYEKKRVLPLIIMQNLSPSQIARFLEQPIAPMGLGLEMQPMRHYPLGTTAAHLLGHLHFNAESLPDEDAFYNYRLPDYRGVLGLEADYDREMRGRAGKKAVQVNRLGYRKTEEIFQKTEPGKNLVLTIDLPVQQAAERALREVSSRTNLRGAAIVMNPGNGDILAMVSLPAYDPNMFMRPLTQADMDLLNDPVLRPQINRATQGIYPPGSIFKIVSGLAALDRKVVRPEDIYTSQGHYKLKNRKDPINDSAPAGDYDFRRAFIRSSNSYFIEYGLRSGLESILDIGHQFFLGEPSGILLEQDGRGVFPTIEELRRRPRRNLWTEGNTAHLCIGQELAVTPIQMATMTAAVANGGNVYWPRLVARIESPMGGFESDVTVIPPARLRGELKVSQEHLAVVRQAMRADVEDPEGTAYAAFASRGLNEFGICGKTGTAQVTQGSRVVNLITWFVSFAPIENPRYVVVVMVESGTSGGGTCAPVVRRIYQELQRRELPILPRGPQLVGARP